MKSPQGRAMRRHHLARIKHKRTDLVINIYHLELTVAERRHQVGTLANSGTRCSCWMCGNPRRYFKEKTHQEKSWLQFCKSLGCQP